jgi:hypothetical protein
MPPQGRVHSYLILRIIAALLTTAGKMIRALTLGAKSCQIGRAYVHNHGAFGGPAVAEAMADHARKKPRR